jgi:putative ATP-binding cassette transporter
MKIVRLLFRSNSRNALIVIFMGLISGAAGTALIAVANAALYTGSGASRVRWLLALGFVAAVVFKVGTSVTSGLLLGHTVQDIILNMCSGLCRKVAVTPLPRLEEIGSPRVMTCLTDDVEVLSRAMLTIPTLVVDVAMLAGCAIYLAWISWVAALTTTVLTIIVATSLRLMMVKTFAALRRARDGRDTLFQHYRSLMEGIKEIKLHRGRKNAFFQEDFDHTVRYLRQENTSAMNRYALADAWSQSMYFMLLGVVLFAFPLLHGVSTKTLTAYVFMALYMMGPILGIVASIPHFNQGHVSLDKLEELGMALDDLTKAPPVRDSRSKLDLTLTESLRIPPLVEFRNVIFRYGHKENGNKFGLGPINLTLHPGELLFIIGGNGSGKSTLAKLITGLYTPDSGEIWADGKLVSPESEDDYRQLYSAVFSDFFLFDRLLGLDHSAEWAQRTEEYLTALGLSRVLKMNGTSFSRVSLSQGERRRLALLVAYMEDRPIYVLDEWAADQDPIFRKIFYLKLLPDLKERGKTVVLISHDDRFFHLGDRVIKLDEGKMVQSPQLDVPAESLQT